MHHPTEAAATVYRCARCRRHFVGATIAANRLATGRPITHCGTPAWFVRNLSAEETATYRRGVADIDALVARGMAR